MGLTPTFVSCEHSHPAVGTTATCLQREWSRSRTRFRYTVSAPPIPPVSIICSTVFTRLPQGDTATLLPPIVDGLAKVEEPSERSAFSAELFKATVSAKLIQKKG